VTEGYKWYEIQYTDAPPFTLSEQERIQFLNLIREAGEKDEYKVDVELPGRLSDFFTEFMYNQDLYRLISVLAEAFGVDRDQAFEDHNLTAVMRGNGNLVRVTNHKKG
jgi:hypothetical protein